MFDYVYSIILYCSILLEAILCGIVYFRDRKNIFNQVFCLATLTSMAYAICFVFRYCTFPYAFNLTSQESLYWTKAALIFVFFAEAAIVYFFFIFPERKNRPYPFWARLLFLLGIPSIMGIFIIYGDTIKDMELINGKYYAVSGSFYPIYIITTLAYFIAGISKGVRKLKHLSDLQRMQMTFALVGVFISTALILLVQGGVMMYFRIYPSADPGFKQFIQWGALSLVFFIAFSYYSIIKHRMLEIELVISRTLGYVLAMVVVISFYMLAVIAGERLFVTVVGYNSATVSSISALVIAFLFHPLQNHIQQRIYNKFFAKRFEYQEFLLEASQQIITKINREDLLNYFLDTLNTYLEAKKVAFFIRNQGTEKVSYYLCQQRGIKESVSNRLEVKNGLIAWMYESKDIFVKEEVEQVLTEEQFSKLYSNLKAIEAQVIVPVFIKDHLEGFISLGKKSSNRIYSIKDLDILNIMATHLGIALENTRLYGEAISDEMTGLYNFRYFQHRLKEEIDRARRYKHRISLMMIDLDHFKHINDNFGHLAGDFVLKEVGRVIRSCLRSIDIPCRYGGDELAVILPETDDATYTPDHGAGESQPRNLIPAFRIMEKVRNHNFEFAGQKIPVTLSIGVTGTAQDIPEDLDTAKLVASADSALYQVKEGGRDRVVGLAYHSPHNDS